MIVAHLSDLHFRARGDLAGLDTQLDRIAAQSAGHLVITGDLLDRWDPDLLQHTLDRLAAHGFLDASRLTIIHGNHDLASSGGHPRQVSDLWRLVLRSWDPPPLLAARRRTFYRIIERRAPGVGLPPGTAKTAGGLRIAAVDSVSTPWTPFRFNNRTIVLRHAKGSIPHRQLRWLSRQHGADPLLVLVHHYPMPVEPFMWTAGEGFDSRVPALLRGRQVTIGIEIDAGDRSLFWRAVDQAGASAVLCGHLHRQRVEVQGGVAVCLNGTSGADWAGRTIAYYRVTGRTVVLDECQETRVRS